MSYVLETSADDIETSARRRLHIRPLKRGRVPRILLIDDDAGARALCVANLRTLKIDVFEAEDGLTGLKLARRKMPDLVLLDVSMPGLDGFQVAESVRRRRKTRNIPLVFVSGETDIDARARELGAIAALPKPFDPVTLASLIVATLSPEPRTI
ncbi:MAG: cyclic di-GMP phosphodiesterase [Gaiellaceae bacterium]|jgi:putative two-component system response regulator|nr:cyclic di-GMP phosphodiesterase [Gaiellaceae bacterium]